MAKSSKTRTVRRGTADIATAMRKRFPASSHALLFEVGNSTGFGCNRHADAIAMSLWPSRGLDVMGFEFKASRSDWLKELVDPAKAEAIQQFCDSWWLAVVDRAIVKPGELPDGWGLMALNSRGLLETITPAIKRTSKPWPKEFLAAVLRSAADPVAAVDDAAIRRAQDEGRRAESEYRDRQQKRLEGDLAELRRSVAEFENSTGVSITRRYGGLSAREFKLAIDSLNDRSLEDHVSSVQQLLQSLDRLRSNFTDELAGIEKLRTAANDRSTDVDGTADN